MNEMENNTLDVILRVAKSEFLDKGYQKASLRNIVKKAGVTTGAFYGYYDNKECLFDSLVKKEYNHALNICRATAENLSAFSLEEYHNEMMTMTEAGMIAMKEYIYEHYDAFKLILCSSDGTKYNNIIHEMAKLMVQANHDFRDKARKNGLQLKEINQELEHMLTSGMLSTFFELIIHDISGEEADLYIRQLLEYSTAGWGKIMGI